MAIAIALSLVLGIVLACVLERMRVGFATPGEVEAQLGLPVIGLVPRVRKAALRAGPGDAGGLELGLALGRLRGVLQVMDRTSRPRVITVTSALPEEGKSTLAAALARNAAHAGWRVLLVDGDLRHPAIASIFGMRPDPGLAQLLTARTPGAVADSVRRSTPKLHVIPTGVASADPQELLASPILASLLDAARSNYDLVVIDAPPVLPTVDALLLAQVADATLLVVRWETTPRAAVSKCLALLQGSGAQVLGAIMTQVHPRRFSHSSGGELAYVYRGGRPYQQGDVTRPG
jgi:capsular exopolysaccharide synthesis family protein